LAAAAVVCLWLWPGPGDAFRSWRARQSQGRALQRLAAQGLIPEGVVYEGDRLLRRKDGAEMVVIPEGDFWMGSDEHEEDERPARNIYLSAYLIDKFEVTNRQFRLFVEASPQWAPDAVADEMYLRHWRNGDYPADQADHPVHHVPWEAAQAYAQWAGAALPTEAQWEKAARGGLTAKAFPWGDDPDPDQANWGRPRWMHARPGSGIDEESLAGAKFDSTGTTPVGAYPANHYGLHDMAGNVWEWCLDWYDSNYLHRMSHRDPAASNQPTPIDFLAWGVVITPRAARGGSWYRRPNLCRCSNRSFDHLLLPITHLTDYYYGFRCVVPLR
jgi:formylglycine-generating enzyme required for sulfatase activity